MTMPLSSCLARAPLQIVRAQLRHHDLIEDVLGAPEGDHIDFARLVRSCSHASRDSGSKLSTNSMGWNSCRSSIFSPTPTKRTGTFNWSEMASTTAFGRAVEFGEHEASHVGHFSEALGLFSAFWPVEPSSTSQTSCGASHHLRHDALDFAQLVHQIHLVVQAAGRVHDDEVSLSTHGGGACQTPRLRDPPHPLSHHFHPNPFTQTFN